MNFNFYFTRFFLIFMYMKKMNLDNVFEIFNQDDEQVYEQAGMKFLMEDDTVLLNTVVRGIETYWKLDDIYTNKFPDQYETVREKVRRKYFNKMFKYLVRINLKKLEPFFDTVGDLGYGTVENSLNEYMEHFVDLEEYEKCAKIKKVLDIVQNLYYPEFELV